MNIEYSKGCEHEDKGSAMRQFLWGWAHIKEDGEKECYCGAMLKYKLL